jgi:hypothetical protein
MNLWRVALLIATTAWLAGNVLLIVLAPVLFQHAPGQTHGGGHDFVSRFAAGVVFGDCIRVWSIGVTYSLLPLTLISGVAISLHALISGAKARCCLWLVLLASVALLHFWSESVIMTLNQLLPDLLAGRTGGERWSEFQQLHRESRAAVTAESAMALVLLLAAAIALLRPGKASATANDR